MSMGMADGAAGRTKAGAVKELQAQMSE